MIQRLSASSLAFGASAQQTSARDAYENKLNEISGIAKRENERFYSDGFVAPGSQNTPMRANISMQGQGVGENLNIIA